VTLAMHGASVRHVAGDTAVRLVILGAVVAAAAVLLGVAVRRPRYAYGRWSDPDPLVPRSTLIIDGP